MISREWGAGASGLTVPNMVVPGLNWFCASSGWYPPPKPMAAQYVKAHCEMLSCSRTAALRQLLEDSCSRTAARGQLLEDCCSRTAARVRWRRGPHLAPDPVKPVRVRRVSRSNPPSLCDVSPTRGDSAFHPMAHIGPYGPAVLRRSCLPAATRGWVSGGGTSPAGLEGEGGRQGRNGRAGGPSLASALLIEGAPAAALAAASLAAFSAAALSAASCKRVRACMGDACACARDSDMAHPRARCLPVRVDARRPTEL